MPKLFPNGSFAATSLLFEFPPRKQLSTATTTPIAKTVVLALTVGRLPAFSAQMSFRLPRLRSRKMLLQFLESVLATNLTVLPSPLRPLGLRVGKVGQTPSITGTLLCSSRERNCP